MPETKLDVRTADGTMDVHLHGPRAGAPTVIFFPDAGGVRSVMHDMAERLAGTGYLVALPNLYYRAGEYAPFDAATVFTDPAERAQLGRLIGLADTAAVMRDVGAILDALADQPGARAGQVGCVGYCMGGRQAFEAAGAHPTRVAAAASIHGGRLAGDEPDSPHRHAGEIGGTLYFGVADEDPSCSPESQALLADTLDAAKVSYRLEQYPGARHGFAVPDMPTYDEAAAERHWQRITTLLADALPTD